MATTLSSPPADSVDENPAVQSLIAAWHAGTIGRRDFLMRATASLGTLAAATMLLEACGGSGPTATPFATVAPTTAATRAAASAAAPAASPSAASPASPTTAPTAGASSSAAATQAPPGTTAAGASAAAGTRPAGSVAAPAGTTTSSSAVAAAGTPVATGVPADAVNAKMVQFPNGGAQIIAYEARPKTGTGPFPAVIVIHENMGLTDHIKDVTRRLAKEGFVGLGIDLLSREGGTMAFNTPQDSTTAIGKLTDDQMLSDVTAAVAYLKGTGVGAPKIGITGFCFGGRIVIIAAEKVQGLSAAVAFYGQLSTNNAPGRVDPTKEAASLSCPLMGNYGALDPLSQGIPAFEAAAKASGQPLDFKVFENTGHAFNNDTRPFANGFGYVPASAQEAWTRTLAWFKKYLA